MRSKAVTVRSVARPALCNPQKQPMPIAVPTSSPTARAGKDNFTAALGVDPTVDPEVRNAWAL